MNSKTRKIILAIAILLISLIFLWQNSKKFGVGNGSAELSWNASSEASGYKIYYGESPRNGDCPPGGYGKNIDAGQVTNYALDNLAAGKTYYFSVTSYNQNKQESCFGEEVKKDIKGLGFGWLARFFAK